MQKNYATPCLNFFSLKLRHAFLVLLPMLFSVASAQVANYSFSQSAGTYSAVGGSTAIASSWDDAVSAAIAIPFSFNFNGTGYTSCYVSSNGFITFGAAAAANNYTPISSNAGYAGAVSALGRDLIANGSAIVYTTAGAAPNRTFIIQWNNARRYNIGSRNADFDFQIRLSESSNVIQVVYGACATTYATNLTCQVGLRGSVNTDFNNRSVPTAGNWNASAPGGTNAATCATNPSTLPSNGLTYTWTPGPTITSFTPAGLCANSGGAVTVNGYNFTGATSVTFNGAPALYTVVSSTQITATLPAGASTGNITVTTPAGSANSTSFTVLPQPAVQPITGSLSVCPGGTAQLADATPGGTWTAIGNPNVSVDAAGLVSATSAATGSATINYTVSGGGCNNTASATVSVIAAPSLGGPNTVCLGGTANLTPASGGTWISNNPSVASIDNSGLVNGLASGTVTFTFTSGTTGCTATAAVSVLDPVSIIGQPVPQIVCSGTMASFSVTATGAGLSYQWFNGAAMLSDGGSVSGATSPTLIIDPASLADASADYHCVVSGTCGPPVMSDSAALTVFEKVSITSQPAAAQTYCEGQAASFSVAATGTGLSYQWYNGAAMLSDGGNVSGSAGPTLTLNPVALTDAGANYYVVVSGTSPCGPVNSSPAALVVNEMPVIVSQPVASQAVCDEDPVSLSILATGGSLTYQWYKGATPVTDGGNISGATTDTLNFTPIGTADAATNYYCVVTNACTSISSTLAEVIVNLKPKIPTQSTSACSDTGFSISPVDGVPTTATVVPAGTTYSWGVPLMSIGLSGGTSGLGEPNISGTLHNATDIPLTATYTVTAISGTAGNCVSDPITMSVTVDPVPAIVNQNIQVCSGQTATVAPITGGGNIVPAGTTYSWALPAVTGGMTGATAGTAQPAFTQTLTNPTGSVQTAIYNVTATSGSCIGATFTVTVTVEPKPDVLGLPATQSICSGDIFSPISISNPNGVTGFTSFTWTRDNTINVTGLAPSGSGDTISGSLVNTTGIAQTVTFTLYATSDESCVSDPSAVTIVVNPMPLPVATPAAQSVCSNIAITGIVFGTSNAIAGTSFTWTRDNTANLTGIPASDSGTNLSGTLVNNTNVAQTTTFTLTGDASGCIGTSTFTVTVDPQPTVSAAPATQVVCGGSPMGTIVFSNPNNVIGTTYSWTRDNVANVTGIANSGTGSGISGTPINNTGSDQIVTFTITAVSGGCVSAAATVTMTVMPMPLAAATPASQSLCNGGAFNIAFSTGNNLAGTVFNWTRTNTANLTGIAASGSGDISGSLANSTTTSQTTVFTIVATAPNGCSKTITASVTVYASLTAPVIIDSQTVCAGSRPTPLTSSTAVNGGSGSYSYQWQSAPAASGPWTNVGAATASYWPPTTTGATPTTFYQLVVTDPCGVVTSNPVSISVVNNVNFTFSASGGGQTVCPGDPFTVGIASGQFLPDSYIKYSYTGDLAYVTPNTGGPAGTTNVFYLFGIPLFAISQADFTLTAINNTTSNVSTTIFITPRIYDADTNAFICSLTPKQVNITIRPNPVATVIAPATGTTVCSATSAGITVSSNITGTSTSYSITRSANANVVSSAAFPIASGSVSSGGTYTINDALTNNSTITQSVTYSIVPTANGCSGTPTTFTVNIAPKLTPGAIGANQAVCFGGDPAAFTETIAATGAGTLTYQWQGSTISAAGPYTDIAGATGTTYDAPSGLTATTWYIRVVTSTFNGLPCSVATTTPVKVTVNTLAAGTISGSQTICSGSSATITGTAGTGTGIITYQWQSNTTGCGGAWADIAGQTAQNLTVPGIVQTTYFRRITISTVGGSPCSDFSNCVAVTVNNVTGGTVGSDQVMCGNNPAAFTSVTASTGSGVLSYQWQSNTIGCGGAWANIGGATGAVYDAPAGVGVTTYYRRVTTSTLNGVSCQAFSNCITVTPNSVTGGAISGNRTVCSGGDPAAFTETVAATGTGLTYQWQVSTTGLMPWTDIPGATSATYDAPGPAMQTLYYQRVASSTIGATTCQATSNLVTVFVNDVTAPVMAGDQTVCSDDPAAFTIATPATGSGAITYQWQKSTTDCTTGWSTIPGATGATYDPPLIGQTTYYRVLVTSTLNGLGCTAVSNCVTVTSMAKTWNGSVSSDWNTAANWTPAGVPDSSNCVVIPGTAQHAVVPGGGYVGNAFNLTVLATGYLEISPAGSLLVVDKITVNAGGLLEVQDDGNLVQTNGVADIGIVTVRRITQPMYKFDYTYWNTPMTFASNYTLGMLSQSLTQFDKYYSWNPSVGGGNGNWVQESAATVMTPSKGYIVRAPNTFSSNPASTTAYVATFQGTPNNGDVNIPIEVGTLGPGTSNDKMNLIGNPYPSAVSALAFVSDPANVGLVEGTVYFWTHHAPPSVAFANPFYGNFTYNYSSAGYASYNALGGTNTVPIGYGGPAPTDNIASGQGFFIQGKANGTAVFRNSMRTTGDNGVFFRPSNPYTSPATAFESHRIWLDLADTQGSFSQILIGYADGATDGEDRYFDGENFSVNAVSLYSMLEGKQMGIQGFALPFESSDVIPLGYTSTVARNFTIGIDHVDGLFTEQPVYLADKLLSVVHDLRESPYAFATEAGTFNDRFELRFINNELGTETFGVAAAAAYFDGPNLMLQAGKEIRSVALFDITGKKIGQFSPETPQLEIRKSLSLPQGVYLLRATFTDGTSATVKVAKDRP